MIQYDTIPYDTVDRLALKSWRDGQLKLVRGTETQKKEENKVAHPSRIPKRHLDRSSRSCTACRRVSHYFTMGRYVSPKNCPFLLGDRVTPSNTWYLWPTRVPNAMMYNTLSMGKKIAKIAPFFWDFVILPEEDRKNLVKIARVVPRRQTDRHTDTDRHTHKTCSLQYFATALGQSNK